MFERIKAEQTRVTQTFDFFTAISLRYRVDFQYNQDDELLVHIQSTDFSKSLKCPASKDMCYSDEIQPQEGVLFTFSLDNVNGIIKSMIKIEELAIEVYTSFDFLAPKQTWTQKVFSKSEDAVAEISHVFAMPLVKRYDLDELEGGGKIWTASNEPNQQDSVISYASDGLELLQLLEVKAPGNIFNIDYDVTMDFNKALLNATMQIVDKNTLKYRVSTFEEKELSCTGQWDTNTFDLAAQQVINLAFLCNSSDQLIQARYDFSNRKEKKAWRITHTINYLTKEWSREIFFFKKGVSGTFTDEWAYQVPADDWVAEVSSENQSDEGLYTS